jgi:hypothetical protein
MNLVWAASILIGASAVMVVAMLLMRRHAPAGGRFTDSDRASGVFGVLTGGFALLLGFVVFLAFTKYDDARVGAETEAITVIQQFETAQLMPAAARQQLSGGLICYARTVVHREWPAMQSGIGTSEINPWGLSMFQTIQTVEPVSASEQSAFDAWLSQTSAREEGRRDRLHAAEGIVPTPVWIVLFFAAGLILLFLLFYGDPAEPAVTQGVMAGSVTAVIVASLLMLVALNRPYKQEIGSLRPVAMERTLTVLDQARTSLGLTEPLPCDASGDPT